MRRKAALIVGANGKVGKALTELLKADNYYVIGTTRQECWNSKELDKLIYTPAFNSRTIIRRITSLDKEVYVDIIFYVAGYAYVEDKLTEVQKKEMYKVNVYEAINLAKAFTNTKFVYYSTTAVLGTTGTRRLKTYAEYKRMAERELKGICRHLTIVRPWYIPDTDFYRKAGMEVNGIKNELNSYEVAKKVMENIDKGLILPGRNAKLIHIINKLSHSMAQKILDRV